MEYLVGMQASDLTRMYSCLADETRLRMMVLLLDGPLCVCHFQNILDLPQVKTSRHLAYLREHRLVEVTRNANWRIYHLPERRDPLLAEVLDSLEKHCAEIPQLRRDRKARKRIEEDIHASTIC